MNVNMLLKSLLARLILPAGVVAVAATGSAQPPVPAEDPYYVLDYEVLRIDGTPERLDRYRGKVVLIVNTASRCGLTPQYEGLETLYEQKKDDGFVILGFPANDFGRQEPGTNDQIEEFCRENYGVTFPMYEKIHVKGDDVAPLYERLIELPAPIGGEPKWNFTKFLVGRDGRVIARFEPRTAPDDKQLIAAIDEALAQ